MTALFHYFKGYLKETFLGPVFKLLEASFELMVPLIIARIVDTIIPKNNENHLLMMIFLLFALASLGVIVALLAQYYSSKAAIGYTKALSDDLFQKIISLPKAERDTIGTSNLVTRMISDTYHIQTGINQFLRLFLRSPFIVFGSVIMAYHISPRLTGLFMLMVVTLFMVITVMSQLLSPIYRRTRHSLDYLVNLIREQLEGVRVIRAFGKSLDELSSFQQENATYRHYQVKAACLSSLVGPLTFVIVNTTLIAVIWQGNELMSHSLLTQGMLVALINYLLQILTELLKMTMLVTALNQSVISAKRVYEIFETSSDALTSEINPPATPVSSDLAIVAENLTFTYPKASKPALKGISFQLKKGGFLGVIGGTGSGKTTLVQLLAHLYEADSGELMIYENGHHPKTVREWREWIALVPQKAQLFKGSIRSNLQLGKRAAYCDSQLDKAITLAQAKTIVMEKEGQLDALVEPFGSNFSGGQRQRLTIARGLLKQAPFLILDDASSALDFLTESKLLSALHQERQEKQRQLIMVSQRTRTLMTADKILVLDKGRLIAQGTHEELLVSCSLYQAIHRSQESEVVE